MPNISNIGLALTIASLSACSPDMDSPCDRDKYACESGVSGWEVVDDCALDGLPETLTVTCGHGEFAFAPLADGEWPEVFSGSQGGHHVFAGFQVQGVATGVHEKLKVNIEVRTPDGELNGSRAMLLGIFEGNNIVSEGIVEDFGLVVFVDSQEPGALKITVTDPCGRSGQAAFPMTETTSP